MTFETLKQIIKTIERQPEWQGYQQFRLVLTIWAKTVDANTLNHSRPYALERGTLWVSTPSAGWAQNLSLQRYSLLKQLNIQLPQPLLELRFTTAHWQQKKELKPTIRETFPCPDCQRLTPEVELERWSVCSFCILQYWSKK